MKNASGCRDGINPPIGCSSIVYVITLGVRLGVVFFSTAEEVVEREVVPEVELKSDLHLRSHPGNTQLNCLLNCLFP